MSGLQAAILAVWLVFWLYWLISASAGGRGAATRQHRPVRVGLVILALLLLLRGFRVEGNARIDDPAVQALGVVLFLAGLALAVWARVNLGRNWGMPMTRRDHPELVTSGPYRLIRHPIYSGILLGFLGTAFASNLYWFAPFALLAIYFTYSARIEERQLGSQLGPVYDSYKAKTKMLVPFVL